MRELFYRIAGRKGEAEPRLSYEGLLIRSADIQRLKESKLDQLDPDFASKILIGANYAQELLLVTTDNQDMSLFDYRLLELIRKTSKPDMTLIQLLDLLEPVYSALRNHQL